MADRDSDRALLATLAGCGSDLTKPAHTIHYLYFTSSERAQVAARKLTEAGYQAVRSERAPAGSFFKRLFSRPRFVCIAETRAVPAESQVFSTSDWFNALARECGGDYDGWEASIER